MYGPGPGSLELLHFPSPNPLRFPRSREEMCMETTFIFANPKSSNAYVEPSRWRAIRTPSRYDCNLDYEDGSTRANRRCVHVDAGIACFG
jgi:hypothetical protein